MLVTSSAHVAVPPRGFGEFELAVLLARCPCKLLLSSGRRLLLVHAGEQVAVLTRRQVAHAARDTQKTEGVPGAVGLSVAHERGGVWKKARVGWLFKSHEIQLSNFGQSFASFGRASSLKVTLTSRTATRTSVPS